eukprot:4631530-Prymnesium_polylepis.1
MCIRDSASLASLNLSHNPLAAADVSLLLDAPWPLLRLALADAELDDAMLERAADGLRRASCVLAHLDLRLNGGLRRDAHAPIRLAWREASLAGAEGLLLEDI